MLPDNQRGMLVTRSTFVGTGAYAGRWLGDNTAAWSHMKDSIIGEHAAGDACFSGARSADVNAPAADVAAIDDDAGVADVSAAGAVAKRLFSLCLFRYDRIQLVRHSVREYRVLPPPFSSAGAA